MDKISKKARSSLMSKIKSKDSKLELSLKKLLSKKGLRFKKNSPKHYGKPDFVFLSKKTAIFVDSCFWHGCKKHFRLPSQNRVFWKGKIQRNAMRDKEVIEHYRKERWRTLRIWEHDFKKYPERVAAKIDAILKK